MDWKGIGSFFVGGVRKGCDVHRTFDSRRSGVVEYERMWIGEHLLEKVTMNM